MKALNPHNMMLICFPKSLMIRIYLVLSSFFLIISAAFLLLSPSALDSSVINPCTSHKCLHMVETGYKTKAMLDDVKLSNQSYQHAQKSKRPNFLNDMEKGMRIGMLNMDREDFSQWSVFGELIPISFKKVSNNLKWEDLFPRYLNEEEEKEIQSRPKMPMQDFNKFEYMDMVVVKIPCKHPKEGWQRDVFRLQLHLVAAELVVKRGRGRTKVVVESKCKPMVEVFRCDDLVKEEGEWWYYKPDVNRLKQKISLPFGTCDIDLPLWEKGINKVHELNPESKLTKREAYATVLHSSEAYVCGAITLAQSLLKTRTNRHLILLIDTSISVSKRRALAAAGWTIRIIERISNPRSRNDTYNRYNYTKLRLWQLTDYHKIIFIDCDMIVLRNLDHLFSFPQMSAASNSESRFNSGIMVIEPSNCTFMHFMQSINEITSYNGGDQGFLNEIFVYWHRFPKKVNFFKQFVSNSNAEETVNNQLFAADPPKLYTIHYFGRKPWLCYRDYDCNWDVPYFRMYASDVANRRWWNVHDAMDDSLQKQCELTDWRKEELKQDREAAKRAGFADNHWLINITDPRSFD
ncbi:unnamed protein product [Lactuca virosa]|uniref:Hexosyltransferase n=1 Tax=Lactuca virosa TaxID=75947 RepID=A0AAU9M6B6_9ASTR|nr:unnamed protein product [Lactuca virosa]